MTGPVSALGYQDHPAAASFVPDLVAALDQEPRGHEGATTLLRAIRRVQFAEGDVERDEYGHPATRISAHDVPLSDHAKAIVEHADSIAAVLARQYDSRLAQTTETVTEALVVLHGIAVTDHSAVVKNRILQQIVRSLREFPPTSNRYHEARGVLETVAGTNPDSIAPHVDPIVADTAAGLRAAEPDPDSSSDPRERAVRRLGLVGILAETHPEETAEAVDWAGLDNAFAGAGPATRKAGGVLLDKADDIDHLVGQALLLQLIAVAARESPETFAPKLSHVEKIADRVRAALSNDERSVSEHGRQSATRRLERAVEEFRYAVEE